MAALEKSIEALVLDTGAIIHNEPSVSTLQAKAESLFTVPAIITEIRDAATRSRVETMLKPFLTVRQPTPESMKFVTGFARRTGDLAVLSKPDLQIIALTYELECERNGGDWRLRRLPGQKELNGPVTEKETNGTLPKEADSNPEEEAGMNDPVPERKEANDSVPAQKKASQPKQQKANGEVPEKTEKKKKRNHHGKRSRKLNTDASKSIPNENTAAEGVRNAAAEPEEASTEVLPQQDEQEGVKLPDAMQTSTDAGVEVQATAPSTTQQSAEPVAQGESVLQSQTPEPSQTPLDGQAGNEATTAQPDSTESSPEGITKTLAETSPDDDTMPLSLKSTTDPSDTTGWTTQGKASRKPIHATSKPTSRRHRKPQTLEDDGWVTPQNLAAKQAIDSGGASAQTSAQTELIRVAVLTTDHAMQNVLLQINLHLLSTTLTRITSVRSTALRCQACFLVSRDTARQFCSRCGKPTLSRVTCSTNADGGGLQIHLSKNYTYNSRGDRYSIPKPGQGSANGKRDQGGGKGGWGNGLILAEDQKEYERAKGEEKRARGRDLMDEDFLPGIVTGERGAAQGGRVKVGAGRNVNSRKR